jgi:V/A-type H+-transporting ATPase subunit K
MTKRSRVIAVVIVVMMFFVASGIAFAQDQTTTDQQAQAAQQTQQDRSGLAVGLLALAAALAIAGTAIATGIAQSRIGAAGAGTIAERPESAGQIIILLAIPETMVILGFIIAVLILFT